MVRDAADADEQRDGHSSKSARDDTWQPRSKKEIRKVEGSSPTCS